MKNVGLLIVFLCVTSASAWSNGLPTVTRRDMNVSRRAFVVGGAVSVFSMNLPANAKTSDLIDELKDCKDKLQPIPQLLDQMEWEKVRAILKTPPVNKLWNLGDSQNTALQLAKATDNADIFEMKDELALDLQMCDQFTYDNAFVYFQPGNGKYNIKEPQTLARKAMTQIQEIIDVASE